MPTLEELRAEEELLAEMPTPEELLAELLRLESEYDDFADLLSDEDRSGRSSMETILRRLLEKDAKAGQS
jgi:hypothetical protein